MVVLAAFAVLVTLVAGFRPMQPKPVGEVNLDLPGGRIRPAVKPLSVMEADHVVKQSFDYSCGSAALATLLRFYLGEKLTEKQVIQGLMQNGDAGQIAKRRAFSLLDMKRFVAALGYRGEGYRAELADLQGLDKPCIVLIRIFDYRHFAVLKGIHRGHVLLTDPWKGDISFTVAQFKGIWLDNVMFLVEPAAGKGLSHLRLKESDLRFIEEDDARRILFDPTPRYTNRAERLTRDAPGLLQQYGK